MCLRRVYIQVLLDGVFFICLLGPFGLKYSSKSNVFFLIFRLNDLSIVESRVLKSSTIITLMSITPLRSVSIYLMYLLLPVKASAYNARDPGSIPELGRSSGEGNGNPLQYSCLENPMDGGV